MDLLAIFVLGATGILDYSVDALLLGIAFQSFQIHRNWNISSAMKLILLILGCALLDSYLWPVAYLLDVSFTIGNAAVARMFDVRSNQPYVDLFGFSRMSFLIWLLQALLAKYAGERLIKMKEQVI